MIFLAPALLFRGTMTRLARGWGAKVGIVQSSRIGTAKILREWPARTKAGMDRFTETMAKKSLAALLEKIPSNKDTAAYRDSLRVGRVRGIPAAYAITTKRSKAKRVQAEDTGRLVLYVRPHQGKMRRIPPEVRVLAEFSPWTADTLPFAPPARVAMLVTRKVSAREVERVREKRKQDREVWKARLAREGIRVRELKLEEIPKAVPDLAYQALALEFGIGGPGKAHWRPAIRSMISSGVRREARQRNFQRVFTDSNYKEWTKWPGRASISVRTSDVKRFMRFQRKLGIKV